MLFRLVMAQEDVRRLGGQHIPTSVTVEAFLSETLVLIATRASDT